jgi:hypothetical protein
VTPVQPTQIDTFFNSDLSGIYTKECGDIALMDKVDWYRTSDRDELAATITFLEYLLTIPVAARDLEYDGS